MVFHDKIKSVKRQTSKGLASAPDDKLLKSFYTSPSIPLKADFQLQMSAFELDQQYLILL